MADQVFILRIEGYATPGDATGTQLAMCAPALPDYAASNYVATMLGSLPSIDGVRWDMAKARVTDARVRWVMRNSDDYPNALFTPRPLTLVDEEVDASEKPITLLETVADLGIVAGKILFCGREAWAVESESGRVVTVVRGAGASEATTHPSRSRVFAYPPVVYGRRFSVAVVERLGSAGSGDEVVICRGYISAEPAAGIILTANWEGMTGLGRGTLLEHRPRITVDVAIYEGDPPSFGGPLLPYDDSNGGAGAVPTFSDDGGLLYLPKSRVVLRWEYASGASQIDDRATVWGAFSDIIDGLEATGEVTQLEVVEVAWSGDSRYSPFGYIEDPAGTPTTVVTDHPCDIALNLLLSTVAGDNYTGSYSWDRGAKLAPHAAMGVDVAQVDVAAFVRARDGDLAGLRARNYWIGAEPTDIWEEMQRLFGVLGYTVGTRVDGTVTLLYLRDIYPGQGRTLNGDDLAKAPDWSFGAITNPLDTITAEVGAGPGGDGSVDVTITAEDGTRYYPTRRVKVGGSEAWKRTPYHWEDAAGIDTPLVRLIARRLRRSALRVPTMRLVFGQNAWASHDLGDAVVLDNALLPSPSTGAGGGSEQLSGYIVAYSPDVARRTATVDLIVADSSGRLALYGPTATVVSYDAGTLTLTVEPDEWSDTGDDATTFEAGQAVHLADEHGVLLSTVAHATVDSVTTATIVLDAHWVDGSGNMDGAGGRNEPAAGDIVILAGYDDARDEDKAVYGFTAAVATLGDVPLVGTAEDPAYLWGD